MPSGKGVSSVASSRRASMRARKAPFASPGASATPSVRSRRRAPSTASAQVAGSVNVAISNAWWIASPAAGPRGKCSGSSSVGRKTGASSAAREAGVSTTRRSWSTPERSCAAPCAIAEKLPIRQPLGKVRGAGSAARVSGAGRGIRSIAASPRGSGATPIAPPERSASAAQAAATGSAPFLCSNHSSGVMPAPATSQFNRLRVLPVALG